MLKMVDGSGIIGVDMICPLGVSTPQPPNYDRVELEGTGILVLPNSLDAPLERLELGGKTEQNQDPPPSPEYPQEIKNSGKWNEEKQKYEVDVKITGKNLFDMNKFIDTCNFTKNEDGIFIIDKRVERYDCFIPANTILSIEVLKVEDSSGAAVLELFYEDGKSMYIGFGQVGVKTFLIQKDVVYIKVLAYRKHEYKYIQLEKGNTATPYEPYKEQTLTLTSDRPITKWDRLVEQGGQIGWLYGGKIIDSYNSEQIDAEYMSSTGSLTVGATVLYKLKTTEFVPLPQSEQNAIRALKTYYPTTVITVDGGEVDPDIKVTYRKEI